MSEAYSFCVVDSSVLITILAWSLTLGVTMTSLDGCCRFLLSVSVVIVLAVGVGGVGSWVGDMGGDRPNLTRSSLFSASAEYSCDLSSSLFLFNSLFSFSILVRATSRSSMWAFLRSRADCAATRFFSFLLNILSSCVRLSRRHLLLLLLPGTHCSSSKEANTFFASTVDKDKSSKCILCSVVCLFVIGTSFNCISIIS